MRMRRIHHRWWSKNKTRRVKEVSRVSITPIKHWQKKKKMFPFMREKSQQGSLFRINTVLRARAICVMPAAWHENRDVGEMGKGGKGVGECDWDWRDRGSKHRPRLTFLGSATMWPLEGGQNKRKYQSSLDSETFCDQTQGKKHTLKMSIKLLVCWRHEMSKKAVSN